MLIQSRVQWREFKNVNNTLNQEHQLGTLNQGKLYKIYLFILFSSLKGICSILKKQKDPFLHRKEPSYDKIVPHTFQGSLFETGP